MKKTRDEPAAIVATLQTYLTEHQQEDVLQEVVQKLQEIVVKTHKATEIVVTSTVALSEKEKVQLYGILKHVVRRDLPIVNTIDHSLIGGFTVRIQDWFLDASIASQLHTMKRRLLA